MAVNVASEDKATITIEVARPIRDRARERARAEGTTLDAVLREHLRAYATGADLEEEAADVRASDAIEARIAHGTESVHDWK